MKRNNILPVMKVIGITGGVGSGKSMILEELRSSFGIAVCQADAVARELQKKGCKCYDAIVCRFGKEFLDIDEEIDRKKLAEIVFASPQKLKELNEIVHPAVKEEILSRIEQEREKGMAFFVIEAALLLEDHYDAICDELWYVYTEENLRRERLKASRSYSNEKIDSIMRNQMEEKVFRARCSRIIYNSGNFEDTKQQLMELLETLENTYKQSLVWEESKEK